MSEDDRQRRRMGDATKGRIADLASGWDVPPEARGTASPEPPPPGAPPERPEPPPGPPESAVAGELPRKKPRTMPPPPPGSPLRTKPPTSEVPIIAPAPPSAPLPLPPPPVGESGRTKAPTRPPPIPAAARAKPDSRPPPIGDEGELTIPEPPKKKDELTPPPPLASSGFDQPQKATVGADPSKGVMKKILDATPLPGPDMRPSSPGFDIPQMTVKEDAPLGLRVGQGIATAVVEGPRGMRGDPTVVPTGDEDMPKKPRPDPSQASTTPFERGDPTGVQQEDRDDATVASVDVALELGSRSVAIRQEASLPRKRGILGDVRYVFTVSFGVAKARRESIAVATELARQLAERKERLVGLGRAAIVSERFDHPALTAAREQLGVIEEDRSQHAGALAAADAEVEQIKRERARRAEQVTDDIDAEDKRLAEIATKLAPLEREASSARRRAGDLAEQLKRLDARIKATEASLMSIKTKREDKAAVQAEIATLKAERRQFQRDEPQLAAEVDNLTPRIASLEAARTEATNKIAELREAEQNDQRRVEELIAAIEARRKVVGRSHADAETARDKALHALAERLLIDRPTQLGRAFEPIDELDMAIATNERRAMELRELQGSVDKRAMARGIAVMVLIVAAAAAGAILALTQ